MSRKSEAERILADLLEALENQHFLGKRPGTYGYSLRVTRAMESARWLLRKPPPDPPLLKEDEAVLIGHQAAPGAKPSGEKAASRQR